MTGLRFLLNRGLMMMMQYNFYIQCIYYYQNNFTTLTITPCYLHISTVGVKGTIYRIFDASTSWHVLHKKLLEQALSNTCLGRRSGGCVCVDVCVCVCVCVCLCNVAIHIVVDLYWHVLNEKCTDNIINQWKEIISQLMPLDLHCCHLNNSKI